MKGKDLFKTDLPEAAQKQKQHIERLQEKIKVLSDKIPRMQESLNNLQAQEKELLNMRVEAYESKYLKPPTKKAENKEE